MNFPTLGIYNATEYALEALSKSYGEELRPLGIDSVNVKPGTFPPDMGANSVEPADIGRMDGCGKAAELPEKMNAAFGKMLSGPNLPDPAEVADHRETAGRMAAAHRNRRDCHIGNRRIEPGNAQVSGGLHPVLVLILRLILTRPEVQGLFHLGGEFGDRQGGILE